MKRSLLSLALAASVVCVAQARAQVPTSKATPAGVKPGKHQTSGVHKPGKITQPAPKSSIFIGGEIVDIPSRDCGQKVSEALDKNAAVPVSDPRCADAMNRALELQEHPKPNDEGDSD